MCGGMLFPLFPMDQHVCPFILSSCKYFTHKKDLSLFFYLFNCYSVGYEDPQMKINGQFSYNRQRQRELPFYVDIREIDLSKRTWQGDGSKA